MISMQEKKLIWLKMRCVVLRGKPLLENVHGKACGSGEKEHPVCDPCRNVLCKTLQCICYVCIWK